MSTGMDFFPCGRKQRLLSSFIHSLSDTPTELNSFIHIFQTLLVSSTVFFLSVFRWLSALGWFATRGRHLHPTYRTHQHMSRDQRLHFPSEARRDQRFLASKIPPTSTGIEPRPTGVPSSSHAYHYTTGAGSIQL